MKDYNSTYSNRFYSTTSTGFSPSNNKILKFRNANFGKVTENNPMLNSCEFDKYDKYRANPTKEKYKNLNREYYENQSMYSTNLNLPLNNKIGRLSNVISNENLFSNKEKYFPEKSKTPRRNFLAKCSSQHDFDSINRLNQKIDNKPRISSTNRYLIKNDDNLNLINNNISNVPLSLKSNVYRNINTNNENYLSDNNFEKGNFNRISKYSKMKTNIINNEPEINVDLLLKENYNLKYEIKKLQNERMLIESKAKEIINDNYELNEDNDNLRQENENLKEDLSQYITMNDSDSNINASNNYILNLKNQIINLKKEQKEFIDNNQRNKTEIENYKKNIIVLNNRIKIDTDNLNDKEKLIQELNDKIIVLTENSENNKNIKNDSLINDLKEELELIKNKNSSLNQSNNELSLKIKSITEENEKLNEELKNKQNNSYAESQISALEKQIESLQKEKDNLLNETNAQKEKNNELTLVIKKNEAEIESYKNQINSINLNDFSNKNEELKNNIEELQKKFDNTVKDCENYKTTNTKLMENIDKKQKEIEENQKIIEEYKNSQNEMSILKNLIIEKDSLIKELTEKNQQLESHKPINKFKVVGNNDGRPSLGFEDGLSDEEKIEKMKIMIKEYKDEINVNKEQLNMLKEEIKNYKARLEDVKSFQGKIKNFNEFKKLFKSVLTWYKPFKKEQKEALKSLTEYFDK